MIEADGMEHNPEACQLYTVGLGLYFIVSHNCELGCFTKGYDDNNRRWQAGQALHHNTEEVQVKLQKAL